MINQNNYFFEENVKVMVVEDDQTNRLVLSALLRKEGYSVVLAKDGAEAISLFEKESPILILMDAMLPKMDGFEATRCIKELSGDTFVPIIFLTALNDEQSLARCIECGGDDFLTKPYKHSVLKAKIDALMRVRVLYQTLKRQKDEIGRYNEILQQEHEIAKNLFSNILKLSSLDATNIQYMMTPLDEANGDLLLVAKRDAASYNYLLGDFTGHGLSAAIGAIPVSQIFYAMTRKGLHISEIIVEINDKLKSILPTGLFFAACILELDVRRNVISIWNGGIPDVLVCSDEGIVKRIISSNLPLGVVASSEMSAAYESLSLSGKERVYVYSDGVIETSNPDGERFGTQRYERIIESHSAVDRFEAIKTEINQFRGSAPQHDDLTLLEINCDPQLIEQEQKVQEKKSTENGYWNISLKLTPQMLPEFEPLELLKSILQSHSKLGHHRERIYMIVTELYTNALEHGLLGLDDSLKGSADGFERFYEERAQRLTALKTGWIRLDLSGHVDDEGGKMVIRIEDSGKGFDIATLPPVLDQNFVFSGRGIQLLRNLCSSINFLGTGNVVEAVYEFDGETETQLSEVPQTEV